MKILTVLLCRCCIVFLLASLSACSPHTKKSTLHQPGADATVIASQGEDDSTAVEPEETAQEELEALSRSGAWEFGATSGQGSSPLPTGIDLSGYDFPITINKQVLYYLDLFQGKQKNNFSRWLARSTLYLPKIQEELKKAGLPQDLAYLAMIESGFNPSAYSPAEACGLWQFIAGTGRNNGLRIDSWVDERRQPEKATKAATRYLSRLYAEFGDWHLAVAAYNGGENRIEAAIKDYNTKDFWEIAESEGIYLETKRYVPKLIAAILIARNPEKFGFTDIQYLKPQQYDVIDIPGGVDLEAVAVTANTSVKQLRTLNNELQKNQTPPKQKNYTLRIPVGTKELVASNLNKIYPVSTITYTTHTVKNNETLTTICALYNISKTTLLKANNLRTAGLKKGLRLQIPSTSTKYVLLKDGERPEDRLAKSDTDKRQMVLHQMKSGETLSKLAKQYQVPVKTIMQWNKITNLQQVKQGQQIVLHLDRSAPEAMTVITGATKVAAIAQETDDIPMLEDSKKRSVARAQPPATPKSKQQTWYVVQNGDSLWTISKKFQISAQDLRQWNNLSDNNLQTGNKLIVKKG